MALSSEKLLKLIQADFQYAAGKAVSGDETFQNFYRHTIMKPNARRLLQSEDLSLNALENIRKLIALSHFQEAFERATELEKNCENELLLSELAFEKARICAFNGLWNEVVFFCSECQRQNPASITELGAIQARSIAYFEIGEFKKALQDIEKIESMESSFPQAVSVRLAKSHKVKVSMRLGLATAAHELLTKLWKEECVQKPINLYYLLILARVEIDLARVEKRNFNSWIHFCLQVSKHIGDDLYHGLALIDLWSVSHQNAKIEIEKALEPFLARFERMRLLWNEIHQSEDDIALSTMAKTICLQKVYQSQSSLGGTDNKEILVLQNIEVVVDLRTNSIFEEKTIDLSKQYFKAIAFLAQGECTRDSFFKHVWQLNYVPDLHDAVVRTFIYRLRKKFNMAIDCSANKISLKTKAGVV